MSFSPIFRHLPYICLLVLLASCTQAVRQGPVQLNQYGLKKLDLWNVKGRGSFNKNSKRVSFSFEIKVAPEKKSLALWSNLAGKRLDVEIQPDHVYVKQGDQQRNYDSVEAFTEKELGWDVDFDHLLLLIRGLTPDSWSKTHENFDGNSLFVESGSINYQADRFESYCHLDLPGRISIEISRPESKLKLLLKKWEFKCP
ncbi:MAG: lipoprotein insertase outer membrane protein LolB [bacterium]